MGGEAALEPVQLKHEQGELTYHTSKIEEFTHHGVPLVSIVIPSRNSERTIADCLRSIISQLHRPIEIIVVDGFSTDSTVEIARATGATVMLHDDGRSAQKNWGAKFANGEYLYFVDADFRLEPNVITACLEAMEGSDGVVISNQDITRGSWVSRLIASRRRLLSYDSLSVAIRFVRKEVFDRLGGFDPDLYAGEDLDFHRRFLQHGFKIVDSQATEWHLGSPVNLKGLLNRSLYYSSNSLRYASKNPLIALKRINPLRVVAAWKKSDAPVTDLLPVVLLGFLSNAFLMISVLLSLSRRQGTPRVGPIQTTLMRNRATPNKKNVIDNYNREGKNYDNIRYGRTKGGRFFSEIELRKTLEMVKGDKVLHIGTATGRVSSHLVSSGFDYVGLELSNVMVRITKEKLNGAGDMVQADAEHLPFKPSVFDDVVSVRSFHFLPNPDVFLNEANRVLKPTGRVTVSFEKNVRGRETFRRLMSLPPSNAKRTYYSNPQVALMMRRARFEALFAGNVTKLPLLLYWRSKDDRILKGLHGKIPSLMGTVGMVVGLKESQSPGVG